MNDKIFVQIASYRDPELLKTIDDCINKASDPERLVFGICWQHSKRDKFDNLDKYKNDPRFRIIDVDHMKSKGACWARRQIQKLWEDEKYTLMIDSHMRFENNWDSEMISMVENLNKMGSKKPILSTYPPGYDPENDTELDRSVITFMACSGFHEGGNESIILYPSVIDSSKIPDNPIPSRFIAAGFIFTYGVFSQEVPYDEDIYFVGEEILLSIRAYTYGYDIFAPNKTLIWHEYTREEKPKHWDDRNKNKRASEKHAEYLRNSDKKFRKLMQYEDNDYQIDPGYFGPERSFKDYELFSGILFSRKKIHPDTLKGVKHPPINDQNFVESFPERKYLYQLKPTKITGTNKIKIYILDASNQIITETSLDSYQPIVNVFFKTKLIPKKWIYDAYDSRDQLISHREVLL